MPDSPSDPQVLIQHYLEGTLSYSGAADLHRLLKAHPEVGEQLLQHLDMDAMLRASKPLAIGQPHVARLLPVRRFSTSVVAGVAALAACVAFVTAWFWETPRPGVEAFENTTASVAIFTQAANLDWESAPIAPGTPLAPGMIRFKSGLAQIEFYQGARVIIEGPAEFEIVSSGEAACTRGKLRAEVPPQAKGFRIRTPKGTIVDLGTEFGLEVGRDDAQVHVFKGEVEVHPLASTMQSLKEGQAASFLDPLERRATHTEAFPSENDLDSRAAQSLRGEFERWLAKGSSSGTDPSLIVRFDFQDREDSRSLINRATPTEVADGSIVGAAWTRGRWPGKGALEFRQVSDRVRLGIPDELASLTMAVSLRVNGLDRTFNSIFMSEGWGDRRVHWQITRDGRVRLGVAGSEKMRHTDYDTPVVFTPERFGRWLHLAVVFDPDSRQVRHYLDGKRIATHPLADASPLRIGIAELGNWNDTRGSGGVAIRHLSGAIDDFSLWSRPLSDKEISDWFR